MAGIGSFLSPTMVSAKIYFRPGASKKARSCFEIQAMPLTERFTPHRLSSAPSIDSCRTLAGLDESFDARPAILSPRWAALNFGTTTPEAGRSLNPLKKL